MVLGKLLITAMSLKVLTSLTQHGQKKANGEYHAQLATRGFKQTLGKSFIHHDISSPVMHDITVIVWFLMLMGNMITHLVDVNGAFLLGEIKPGKKIYMKIKWGFEKFSGLLFLKWTLYGVKKAAKHFGDCFLES